MIEYVIKRLQHFQTLYEDSNSPLAEVFYYVNYVNVNYLVKNSTVDGKYLL